MKRRILLVDDEVAVLLTLKAVLEISGFDVDTATSAREGKSRIKHREYEMVITDMRMEGERAGEEVIQAAKAAPYKPAIATLSAFQVDEDALLDMGADKVLVKPMHTRQLLQQLEALYVRHHGKTDGKADAAPKPNGSATHEVAVAAAEEASQSSPKRSTPPAPAMKIKAASATSKPKKGPAKKSVGKTEDSVPV